MSKYSESTTLQHNDQPLILDSDSEANTHLLTNTSKSKESKSRLRSKSWHCAVRGEDKQIGTKRRSAPLKSKACHHTPRPTDHEVACTRDMLEMMLTRTQIKEHDVLTLQKKLHKKYEHMQEILEALMQYIDCVSLEQKSSARLTRELNKLALNEDILTQNDSMQQLIISLTNHVDVDFYPVKSMIYKVMQNTDVLDELFSDYKDKKNDFNKAIQNFKIILDTQKLNAYQMNRLRKQFEVIQMNFKHSRCMLDHKLPQIIKERRDAMLNCLEVLQEELNKISSDRTNMVMLLEHLESSLKSTNDEIIYDVNAFSIP